MASRTRKIPGDFQCVNADRVRPQRLAHAKPHRGIGRRDRANEVREGHRSNSTPPARAGLNRANYEAASHQLGERDHTYQRSQLAPASAVEIAPTRVAESHRPRQNDRTPTPPLRPSRRAPVDARRAGYSRARRSREASPASGRQRRVRRRSTTYPNGDRDCPAFGRRAASSVR